MTKYKEEIVDIIKKNTYNETDGRNLIRRGHDDLVEFYISEEKEMLNELDEGYRKAEAFDEIKISYYMHIPNDMIGFAKQTEQTILRYKESEDE